MQMEELVGFLQSDLEKNFRYTDDQVIDSLQLAMDELKRAKLDLPEKGDVNELPTKPFGLFVPPSMDQFLGRRTTTTTDTDVLGGDRLTTRESRPQIPADGGPESLPPGMVRHISLDDDMDAMTDAMSSIADYRSSRTSFMDQSDVASTVTTMSRPFGMYSSFNTLNDTLNDMGFNKLGDDGIDSDPFHERTSPTGQSQASEYDNVTTMYEQDLERTLEGMELDGNATFKRGMTLLDYNGFEDLTPRPAHSALYQRGVAHGHKSQSSDQRGATSDHMSRSSDGSDLTPRTAPSSNRSLRLSESSDLTPRAVQNRLSESSDLTPRAIQNHQESAFHFQDTKQNKSYDHGYYEFQETRQVTRKIKKPGAAKKVDVTKKVTAKNSTSRSPVVSPTRAHYVSSLLNGYQQAAEASAAPSSSVTIKVSSRSSSSPEKRPIPATTSQGSYL